MRNCIKLRLLLIPLLLLYITQISCLLCFMFVWLNWINVWLNRSFTMAHLLHESLMLILLFLIFHLLISAINISKTLNSVRAANAFMFVVKRKYIIPFFLYYYLKASQMVLSYFYLI